jgi:hypothetical protein
LVLDGAIDHDHHLVASLAATQTWLPSPQGIANLWITSAHLGESNSPMKQHPHRSTTLVTVNSTPCECLFVRKACSHEEIHTMILV